MVGKPMGWVRQILGQPATRGHNTSPVYYVYILYIYQNSRKVLIYAGKGSTTRMYAHEKILERKLKSGVKLDAKERLILLLKDLGYTIYAERLYTGLTEDEAFNLENRTITENQLLQRGNVAWPHRIRRSA
jgi:hypothetical protein